MLRILLVLHVRVTFVHLFPLDFLHGSYTVSLCLTNRGVGFWEYHHHFGWSLEGKLLQRGAGSPLGPGLDPHNVFGTHTPWASSLLLFSGTKSSERKAYFKNAFVKSCYTKVRKKRCSIFVWCIDKELYKLNNTWMHQFIYHY